MYFHISKSLDSKFTVLLSLRLKRPGRDIGHSLASGNDDLKVSQFVPLHGESF